MAKKKITKEAFENKLMKKSQFIDLENGNNNQCKRVKSTSLKLNNASNGGFPAVGVVEIYGAEQSGKTTVSLDTAKNIQKENIQNVIAFIDLEHSLDVEWAKKIGVNLKSAFQFKDGQIDFTKRNKDGQFLFSQPDSAEETFEIIYMLLKRKEIKMIIIDSVAALTCQKELDGKAGDTHISLQARLMSEGLRKITTLNNNTLIFFTNQIRHKIGGYGNPETTPGGNALKFYAIQRYSIYRKESITDKDGNVVGSKSLVKLIKNKIGGAHKTFFIAINNSFGIDTSEDIFSICLEKGIIKQSGSWFVIGNKKFQGENQIKEYIRKPEVERKLIDYVNTK